jgi:hypothetical protein
MREYVERIFGKDLLDEHGCLPQSPDDGEALRILDGLMVMVRSRSDFYNESTKQVLGGRGKCKLQRHQIVRWLNQSRGFQQEDMMKIKEAADVS